MEIVSSKSKPLWSTTFSLCIGAAVFTAFFKVADNITMHNIIVLDDVVTAVSAYFILAGWIGVISSLVFSLLFGKSLVDQEFTKIHFGTRKMQLWAMLAGGIGSGGTFFLLWANRYTDPSTAISLGMLLLVFMTIYDLRRGEVSIKNILFPLLLVIVGGMLTSFTGSLTITLQGILLIGILSNGLCAFSEIAEQKGVRLTDGVNFFFWRFLWLGITGTTASLVIAVVRGTFPLLIQTIFQAASYTPWFVLTMLFVFLGIALKLTAKKKGAASVVLMVLSGQIVLGYLITLLINAFAPGLFGQIPSTNVWIVRFIGATVLVVGCPPYTKNIF